ncbi:MAG: hypothetical protein LLG14_27405 [Nocardiaceae bacterium]|nr:hypothetical protein [Nocardiaceae bacterium]
MTIEAKLDETNKLLGQLIELVKPRVEATPPPTTGTQSAPPKGPTAAEKKAAQKAADEKKVADIAAAKAEAEADKKAAADDFSFDEEPEAAVAETKLTVDDARKALVALQKAKQSPEASRKILTAAGFSSLAGLKDENQDAIKKIIADCAAQMPK